MAQTIDMSEGARQGTRRNPWPEDTPSWKKLGFKSKAAFDKAVEENPKILNYVD